MVLEWIGGFVLLAGLGMTVGGSLPIGLGLAVLGVVIASIRVLDQWDRGLVLTLGKYTKTLGPGLNFVIPFIQTVIPVDMRIRTVDVRKQEVMTKDNVPVSVDAVIYYKVEKPEEAVLEIQDYAYAVAQYCQTALRDVIGNSTLDEALTEREKLAVEIKKLVDKETTEWGVDITAIKMQDIALPEQMKRAMARQAEAEREKRSTIILSEAEVAASSNLAKAASTLGQSPGALHLRTLQTIADISSDPSQKIIFVTPIEVLDAFKGFVGGGKKK